MGQDADPPARGTAAKIRFTLRQVAGENLKTGKSTPIGIGAERVVLGRAEDADICVPLASVGAQHAALEWIDGALHLLDLGSESGTFINFTRVAQATALRRGDLLSLGREALFLVGAYTPEEAAAEVAAKDAAAAAAEPVNAASLTVAPDENADVSFGDDHPTEEHVTPDQPPPLHVAAVHQTEHEAFDLRPSRRSCIAR